jgi:rubrerythrin
MNDEMARALAVLQQAMENERKGREFYLQAAEKARSPRGKATLAGLADDEADHQRLLESEYRSLTSSGQWLEAASLIQKGMGEAPLAPLFPKGGPRPKVDDTSDDIEALKFALAIEERAFMLYQSAARETSDPHGRAVYDFLTGEENRHYRLIHETLDYLTHPETWFDTEEKPFFEGG